MFRPYHILLHTASPATRQHWRSSLPEPIFAVLDQPRDLPPNVPLDVLLASQLPPQERQRLLDAGVLGPETRIAIVGPGRGAHVGLPANCSPGELRRTCRLLGQLARRQRTIVNQRRALRQLARQARLDPLTGLANRRLWDRTLAARLRQPVAGALLLVLIDVDHFKVINQLHGQSHGDQVLCHVADRLRNLAGHCSPGGGPSLVARLGGDEFGLLLPLGAYGPSEPPAELAAQAWEIAEHWRLAAGGRNVGPVAEFSVSAGWALWPAAPAPPGASSTLYDAASGALQQAKAQGRNRTCPSIRR